MKTFLITVNNESNIGINEIERMEIINVDGIHKYVKMPPTKPKVKHEDETADSASNGEDSKPNKSWVSMDNYEFLHHCIQDMYNEIRQIHSGAYKMETELVEKIRALEITYKNIGVEMINMNEQLRELRRNSEKKDSASTKEETMSAECNTLTMINKSDIIDIKKRFNKLHGRMQQIEERMFTKDDAKEADYKHSGTHSQLVVRLSSITNRLEKLENITLDNLETAVKTDSNAKLIKNMYETQPEANKYYNEKIEELTQKTTELENKIKELCPPGSTEQANAPTIRTRCHITPTGQFIYSETWRNGKWEKDEKTNCPEEEEDDEFNEQPPQEPDTIEQIKAGEKRLIELLKANNTQTEEFKTLKQYTMKLVSIHTGFPISGIGFIDRKKILYSVHKKGFRIEFE